MTAGRRRPLERLHRLVEPGEDVGLAQRLDPGDRAAQVADPAQWLRPDHPVSALVEGDHAELVAGGHRRRGAQDRLLPDVDLADALER